MLQDKRTADCSEAVYAPPERGVWPRIITLGCITDNLLSTIKYFYIKKKKNPSRLLLIDDDSVWSILVHV